MILLLIMNAFFADDCTANYIPNYNIRATGYTVDVDDQTDRYSSEWQIFDDAMVQWNLLCAKLEKNSAGFNIQIDVEFIDARPDVDNEGHMVIGTAQPTEQKSWTSADGTTMNLVTKIKIRVWAQNYFNQYLAREDIKNILIHEIGHAFGLHHSTGACTNENHTMEPKAEPPDQGESYNYGVNYPSNEECDKVAEKVKVEDPNKTGSFSGSGSGSGSGGGGGGNLGGDLCAGVICPSGHICRNGACMPDQNGCVIPCPTGYQCQYGVCTGVFIGDPDCDPPFNSCDGAFKARRQRGARYISLGRGLILCVDLDRDGMLAGRHEVFRGYVDEYAEEVLSPWDALERYDDPAFGGNSDGVIDHNDRIWPDLRVHSNSRRFILEKHPSDIGLDLIEL